LGNGKNMGSETKGGVLDINFGNVDICLLNLVEKNTSDHCKKTVYSYPADYFLGYDNGDLLGLPSLQLVVEKEVRQAAYRLYCSNHFKKSDWGIFSRWQWKISQFYWLLLTVCYFWRYLIGNICWNITLRRRYGYLKLQHGFLPMAQNSLLLASCLRAGRVLEFFFRGT
jgi:hypothetical protein